MKRVGILWTGGFDSTFRISQLSRCDVEIQPVYVYNNDRKSRQYELNAISEIPTAVAANETTNAISTTPTVSTTDAVNTSDTTTAAVTSVAL